MNTSQLIPHLQVKRYRSFVLTDAIRPGLTVPIVPQEGYRVDRFRDPESGDRLKSLVAAVSAERLFDVFLDCLEPLGDSITVVMESSHETQMDDHLDLRRSDMDSPVLASTLLDFEDLLLHDGCTGIAVLAPELQMEVQFDEHKQIAIYSPILKPFRAILRRHGIEHVEGFQVLSDAEHFHQSQPHHQEEFQQLCLRLGVADFDHVFSDENS
ncbi:Uncharacterized protein OS=Singulisphaera acidiphila (strain ATCC BAA-1392 / DSM 18658 / VKM B-2454 / MOB10) GN=Sinac_3284 PE=4 SV=1 [Tuwongella immobilis]|uniref:Uncharacterized protein n=1 Tax=Tuwongella immobilis TaxID=692036 RepID=A0A6C2YQ06_9BACT|nr:Uncharacterized protein OS=Singulisphaera acidiphila (strain ATCC BAA-1392 / DSM 18658 / VKM B-2454 / MOB10) GN=Sinac_3284 PE=4 SV=1 [Tuwongella immobilis]VTS03865.1 Uncharacterized protein OS=Singulisphaera acidiphila (strain ATCC BAA-1392 / DSM 18658 / VKM B-2454 / MOB10) GN=Sinac_3284 PE=4 SV=1 [Tuwongella immobilis]